MPHPRQTTSSAPEPEPVCTREQSQNVPIVLDLYGVVSVAQQISEVHATFLDGCHATSDELRPSLLQQRLYISESFPQPGGGESDRATCGGRVRPGVEHHEVV